MGILLRNLSSAVKWSDLCFKKTIRGLCEEQTVVRVRMEIDSWLGGCHTSLINQLLYFEAGEGEHGGGRHIKN